MRASKTLKGVYHEHAAPLRVIQRGLHHEQFHCLGGMTCQELDERLSERTARLNGHTKKFMSVAQYDKTQHTHTPMVWLFF